MKTDLDICREELRQKSAELEEFIYIVSHDVKAPLRAITNLTAWIEDDLADIENDEIKENINLLKNRVNRMERMLSALTDISRIHRMGLEISPVDVEDLCSKLFQQLNPPAQCRLKMSDLPVFETYSMKLKRVFHELLSNAVMYSGENENLVEVEAADKGDFYEFKISDQGIGIADEALGKVMKIFYTVHIKDERDTTGAGLTIVSKILQFVGGKIKIESKENQGSRVVFTWPKRIVQPNIEK
jgi:signal transduction histidine kinase